MAKMGMEVIAQSDGVGVGCNFLDSIHNISILLLGIIVQSTQETFQQHNFPVLGIFVVGHGQISSICKRLVTLVTGKGSLFSVLHSFFGVCISLPAASGSSIAGHIYCI